MAASSTPPYAIEQYLEEAERRGVRHRRASLETHTHADHVSGHGRLALEHGVPVSRPPGRGGRVRRTTRSRTATSSSSARSRSAASTRPGHRPEHCCFAVDRPLARRRALARAHRRLALRRRRRASRSRGRGARGRRGALPLAAPAARAARRRRGLPRPRRRLALRQGDELEGVDDDRLRAPLQPRARPRELEDVRRRVGRGRRAEAAERRADRRAQPRAVRRRARRRSRSCRRRRRTRSCSTCGRPTTSSPATFTARSTSRVAASSFATRAGFVLDPERRRDRRRARRARGGRRASAACAPSASSTSPATCSAAAARPMRAGRARRARARCSRGAPSCSTCARRTSATTGYIAGSRNVPYRLLARCGARRAARPAGRDDLRERRAGGRRGERPRCARASTRDPCVDGGIPDWVERGGTGRRASAAAARQLPRNEPGQDISAAARPRSRARPGRRAARRSAPGRAQPASARPPSRRP